MVTRNALSKYRTLSALMMIPPRTNQFVACYPRCIRYNQTTKSQRVPGYQEAKQVLELPATSTKTNAEVGFLCNRTDQDKFLKT